MSRVRAVWPIRSSSTPSHRKSIGSSCSIVLRTSPRHSCVDRRTLRYTSSRSCTYDAAASSPANHRYISLVACQISNPSTSRMERAPSRAARTELRIDTGFSVAHVM